MQGFDRYWIGVGDIHEETENIHKIPGIGEAAGIIVSGDITRCGGLLAAKTVLEELVRANLTTLAQIGNMDDDPVNRWLCDTGINIHASAKELAPGIGLIGLGYSNQTPFNTPSEASEETMQKWLDEAYSARKEWSQMLFVTHTPPYGTKADALPNGKHVGSEVIRRFILEKKPTICLTGHIHEAKSTDTLGSTTIVNPGPLGQGGYALIGVKNRQLSLDLRQV